MIKILVGDEPYWIDSEIRKSTDGITLPELNLMKTDRFNEEVTGYLDCAPFLSDRKAAVVTVANLSDVDGPLFKGFACPEGCDLIIRAREHDARKAFFKELCREGLITTCSKAALGKKLDGFILKKAAEKGIRITEEALRELLYLENYQDAEEVTCYSILADLDSIAAAGDGDVTVDTVRRLVPSHVKGNAFVVAGMISAGNAAGLISQAEALKGQEIPSLAALLREYRIAYKSCLYRLAETGVARKSLDVSREEAAEGVRILTEALRSVKSDSPKGHILQETYLRLLDLHLNKKKPA